MTNSERFIAPLAFWARSIFITALLCSCSSPPHVAENTQTSASRFSIEDQQSANEIVLQAMGLIGTGYKFGGINPEAGLDCSGMVSLVVERATGRRLPHNAARIASITRPVSRNQLRPADLVFFNTDGSRYSHMGIYLGNGRFIHAPSSKGKVRIDTLSTRYFDKRFSGARSLFP